MRLTVLTLLIAALPATALAQTTASPPSARAAAEQAKESLLRADMEWSDSTGKLGLQRGLVTGMAWDAVYLHPGADVLHGRDNVQGFITGQIGDRETEVHWTPLRAAVSRDGTGGYTSGVLVAASMNASGERVTSFGRYITFWRRGEDGAWQARAVMHARSARLTPAPEKERARDPQMPMVNLRRDTLVVQADRAFSAMAAARGAQAAFVAFAAPNVVNIGQQIAYGPAEVGASFQGDRAHWSWSPVLWGASDDGDLGFTVGEATIAGVGPDGRQTSYTKYLTIWQRQPDGSYKFVTDGGNGRPPAPAPTH
ncbi:MAG TPA: DUF4440 domain-containing protein [Longimicrobiaceae bacterium]|nr:DUF4440 domain-containing protein [Longimicrobiaceae bacterium]